MNKIEKQIEKNEKGFRDLWDNTKNFDIHVITISEKKKGAVKKNNKNKEEAENFQNLVKNVNLQIQETQ